jgi:hypothetical protein
MMSPISRSRGATLVEVVVFTAMSLLLIGFGWDLLRSGSVIGSTTSEGLNLQRGVRNFMENLVKDVNAAVLIADPHGLTPTPATRIVVYVFHDAKPDPADGMVDPGPRLDLNGGPDGPGLIGGVNPYPFAHTEEPTEWGLPVIQVVYDWDATTKKVTRTAIEGFLVARADRGQVFVRQYGFQPGSGVTPVETVVSEHIEELEVFPFGYDEIDRDDAGFGGLKPTSELPDFVSGLVAGTDLAPQVAGFTGGSSGPVNAGTTNRHARTAMILVKLRAVFDYANPKYRDPEFVMATRIWSYAKLYEHRYFPYFSSVDDDLRF